MKKIEQDLEEAKSSINEKQQLHKNCVAQVSLLEQTIYEHANNREGRLKILEKKIKEIKGKMQSASKDLKVSLPWFYLNETVSAYILEH